MAHNLVTFSSDTLPNRYPGGELPWHVYQNVRNEIVRVCRHFGKTGPMGECHISNDLDGPDWKKWQYGDPNPEYYIIDDQHGHDCYIFIELYGLFLFNLDWINSIQSLLSTHNGWGVCICNIPHNYVIVFSDRILIRGRGVVQAHNVQQLVDLVNGLLKPKPRWQRSLHDIWRRLRYALLN